MYILIHIYVRWYTTHNDTVSCYCNDTCVVLKQVKDLAAHEALYGMLENEKQEAVRHLQGEVDFVRAEAATLLRERSEQQTERERERAADKVERKEKERGREKRRCAEKQEVIRHLQGEVDIARAEAATLLQERSENETQRKRERADEKEKEKEREKERCAEKLECDKLNAQHKEERERDRGEEKFERDRLHTENAYNLIEILRERDALKVAGVSLLQERDTLTAAVEQQKERRERSERENTTLKKALAQSERENRTLEREHNTLKQFLLTMEAELSEEKTERESERERERKRERKREREKERSSKGMREEERRECVVCLEAVEGWMMLRPCGHVCVCVGCSKTLTECPICRSAVSDSLLAFL